MSQIKHKVLSKGGSLTIPADIRREHNFQGGEAVDITVNNDGQLIVSQHTPRCIFCQRAENVGKYRGKNVCRLCVGGMVMEVGSI